MKIKKIIKSLLLGVIALFPFCFLLTSCANGSSSLPKPAGEIEITDIRLYNRFENYGGDIDAGAKKDFYKIDQNMQYLYKNGESHPLNKRAEYSHLVTPKGCFDISNPDFGDIDKKDANGNLVYGGISLFNKGGLSNEYEDLYCSNIYNNSDIYVVAKYPDSWNGELPNNFDNKFSCRMGLKTDMSYNEGRANDTLHTFRDALPPFTKMINDEKNKRFYLNFRIHLYDMLYTKRSDVADVSKDKDARNEKQKNYSFTLTPYEDYTKSYIGYRPINDNGTSLAPVYYNFKFVFKVLNTTFDISYDVMHFLEEIPKVLELNDSFKLSGGFYA